MDRRVVVVGAGAIGAGLGGLLALNGVPVQFVARGDHGRAMREEGLELWRPHRQDRVRVPTVRSLAEVSLRPDDLVLVCVMGQHTEQAVAALPAGQPVVSLQNGTRPLDALVAAGHPTTAGMVFVPAERPQPGRVLLPGSPAPGTVWLGRWPDGNSDDAGVLAELLASVGFRARAVDAIGPWTRAKSLANLGGIVVALCDAPPSDVVDAARAEARAVWAAAGIETRSVVELVEAVGPLTVVPVGGHLRRGGSTRHALQRGQTLETASLHGPIVSLGRTHGVATPVNQKLIELAHTAAAEAWVPGSLSADALRALVA